MRNKAILHLDLDTFFVSVERLINSELQNKPLLVGGLGDRGVVAACSYETRKFGVHSGMPMKTAKYLCPRVTVMKAEKSPVRHYFFKPAHKDFDLPGFAYSSLVDAYNR